MVVSLVGVIVAYCLYEPWGRNLLTAPIDALAGRTENPFVLSGAFISRLSAFSSDNEVVSKLKLHFTDPTEVFLVKIKLSMVLGLVLASPVVFFQIWRFIGAGLTGRERRMVRAAFPATVLLFVTGVALAYLVMFPIVMYFLIVIIGRDIVPVIKLSSYTSLLSVCCLALGVVFQTPVVIFFLAKLGIVSPSFLVEKRKYAILLMFVLASMLTPPDVITQVMMALPMILLYECGILVARMVWTKRREE